MTDKPLVSIIIRTKDEERWIGACLRAVFRQTYPNFEVILVDNMSADQTVAKASNFDVRLVRLEKFLPGKAINEGIRASKGDYLVCLSGHCIPVDDHWLENLVADLSDPKVAGVYGRQEPLSFSTPFDKRDLMIVFGLDKKIQKKDSFFHNANSAFRRELWERFPFDEEVTNIEDRVWGNQVVAAGYGIVYEPAASVYHHHGIHQDLNPERAERVVRIMEELDGPASDGRHAIDDLNVVAIVPVKGPPRHCAGTPLLSYTVNHGLQTRHIDQVVVATDLEETAALARQLGAEAPFLRPAGLSESFIGIAEVLQWSLQQIEDSHGVPDLVVVMEETHPFRPSGLIDAMIERVVNEGLDTIVAAKSEGRRLWLESQGQADVLSDDRFAPRQFKDSHAYVSLFGLGCVTHPNFIREGEPLGPKLGIYDVHDPFAAVELRDNEALDLAAKLIEDWHLREATNGGSLPRSAEN